MKIVQVSVSLNIFDSLSYGYTGAPDILRPGLRVVVPVGNRLTHGWVTDTESGYKGRVKNILAVIKDAYSPDETFLNFAHAVSRLYFTSVGTLLDATLPPNRKNISGLYFENPTADGKLEKLNKHSFSDILKLSKDHAIEAFFKSSSGTAPCVNPGEVSPLSGPPTLLVGYSRENDYEEMVKETLGKGKSVLITVPDNLTAARFREVFGDIDVDIYNSEIKPKERGQLWEQYASGSKTGVVVGGISAAMLPIANLGLIISDRAGSPAYKRTYYSPYNINTLSMLRAQYQQVPFVQGFSTYTVQAYRDRSQLTIEDKREQSRPVEIRQIRKGVRGIPDDFTELVAGYFNDNKKILIVLNKKESTRFLFCGKCKKFLRCPACDGFLDVDEESGFKCLHCGLEKKDYTACPKCGDNLVIIESISIASVKKAVKQRVAESGLMSMSSEGLKEEHLYNVMRRVQDSRVVISTPVIVNPYFFNLFDAVIYLRPESYYDLDTYDGAEKTFSMIAELRELVKPGGSVDVFSAFSFHYAIKLLNDEDMYFERELQYREWFHLPPYCNLYHIEIKEKDLRKLGKEMRKIYQKLKEKLHIKRIYLTGRKPVRGNYKGILEAHTQPQSIIDSGLLAKRNISISLELV